MAVAQIPSTTLTNAVAALDNQWVVGSTSSISVGMLLAVAGRGGLEIVKVQEIPVAGTVRVLRGVAGTRPRAVQAGAILYYGTPDLFKKVRDNAAAIVGDSSALPDYCLPGTRARDGAGNEYVLVDLQATVYSGVTVLIDSAHDGTFFAAVLTSTSQGIVGVMAEEGTSNQFAWAQIYGQTVAQDSTATSAADSTYLATAASSVSTPAAGMAAIAGSSSVANTFLIKGMFIVGAATSATTSATSHTGIQVPVFLNYPYVTTIQDAAPAS